MGPRERFLLDLKKPGFVHDADQLRAVDVLDAIHNQLVQAESVAQRLRKTKRAIPGLYLWGGVGRGKTYLVDNFFDGLPFTQKRRLHCQQLMQHVHEHLARMPRHPDPMPGVARHFIGDCRVLCIDEFRVTDVGDAMILAGLLRALLELNVTLCFTSNIAPNDLYLNGLQRDRFLPAIDLIIDNTNVVHLSGERDYRLLGDQSLPHFFCGVRAQGDDWLRAQFDSLAGQAARINGPLQVNHRYLHVRAHAPGVVWFDFEELCATARSAHDYQVLCNQFTSILLSDIMTMQDESGDIAARFIQLIDAIYDHNINFWAHASVPLDALYTGRSLAFEFQRTRSRLQELLGPRVTPKYC